MWSVEELKLKKERIKVLKTEILSVNGVNARNDMA